MVFMVPGTGQALSERHDRFMPGPAPLVEEVAPVLKE